MKRRKFLFTSLSLILLSVGVIARHGGSGLRSHSVLSSRTRAQQSATTEELFSSVAGQRWLSGQPGHWRALLLHR